MISKELLKMLRCPETHEPLVLAEPALIERLDQQIAAVQLRNRAGQLVQEKLEDGLIRNDHKYLYPIRHGIPVMLVDEGISIR